jgi:predicted dehydrogenase
MKKVRVGVVGVGYLGKFHAEKYSHMNAVELVGVVDIDPLKAQKIAKQVNTSAFTHYDQLFGKVDAVSIAVPTPVHYTVGKAFLKRDVDVLIEKPMTTSIEEADELIRTAEAGGLILQVGHLERFNPATVALQDIVKRPLFIEAHRLSVFKDRNTDVSVVLDLMIHDIDLILNFVQAEVKSIHAAGAPVICEHVDIANVRLEFDSGGVANVTASRISAKNERKIRIFQKDAYISVDFANHDITVIGQSDDASNPLIPGMDIKQLSFSKADALEQELSAFITAVSSRQAPQVSGRAGRQALTFALEIMEQIEQRLKLIQT